MGLDEEPVGQKAPDFIEQLPLGIYACDAQGRILWFNQRAAAMWGRSPAIGSDSDLYCGSHKLHFQGNQIARDQTPMATVLRTGNAIRGEEGMIERPDGSEIWAMFHIEPVEDEEGRLIGAINCFHDIGERIRAQKVIHEQGQRLSATYDHARIGIAEVQPNGRLQRVNPYLAELLGYTVEELAGRSIFDAALTEGAEIDRSDFERQVRGEIDHYNINKRFIRKDGSKLWVSVASSSVRDPAGNFLYAVRVQHDITSRKEGEEALIRHIEEQSALYEFTDGLQRATSLDRIQQLGLKAIRRALRCDRAAILLLDEAGAMRFVASSGLSERYKLAVEGHSPWRPDVADPLPIHVGDVDRSDFPAASREALTNEGIGALSFIPIVSQGRLLGKFVTYYNQPHAFQDSEERLALTIARQVGFALERARIEAARQLSERAANHLVAIVESSSDAIVSKDLNGVIMSWNDSAERLFGYPAAAAIGRPVTMLIPPDRLDEEAMILGRIRRGERVEHFETIRRRADGSLIDISLTISPIRDSHGRITGASKIARDISDRKAAEAKLRASESHMKALLAALPAAIYTTDPSGKITYFNEAAVELAGRTPVVGTEKWCVSWKLFWPDGTPLPHDQCPMAVALTEGRIIRGVEAVAERPDGTRVPFIAYPTPLRDETGAIIGGINMLVDVSERKQAETQQRLLFNELNHRVKNNMQMLQSLLALAGRRTSNAEARRVLADASERIAAAAAAQQVLYATTNATHFSARELLRSVCETARQTLPADVRITHRSDDIVLSNDAAMPLALVLNELLTNAAKYGHGAGQEKTVTVTLVREDDANCLCVEDDGPGFDLSAVRHRASGLRLVQGLTRQLRGQFSVTTTPRTRCMIKFP